LPRLHFQLASYDYDYLRLSEHRLSLLLFAYCHQMTIPLANYLGHTCLPSVDYKVRPAISEHRNFYIDFVRDIPDEQPQHIHVLTVSEAVC